VESYEIVRDSNTLSGVIGQKCESIEQVLEFIMGGENFSRHIMKLTADKLSKLDSNYLATN
jgi:hypothetical protein